MAKTLIKIAIALLVIHGAFRVGMAYYDFYRFEDALEQLALFGTRRSDQQLCDDAMATAVSFDVPISPANMAVVRGMNPPFSCGGGPGAPIEGRPMRASDIGFLGTYVESVLLLPGYSKPWDFKVQVAVRATR
jgi:hypothetical protein